MNPFLYSVIGTMIGVIPIIVLAVCWFYLRNTPAWLQFFSLSGLVLLGWALIAGSTLLYWPFAIEFAPTQEIASELATKDGGPKTFALLFGWVYAVVLLLILEIVRWSIVCIRGLYVYFRERSAHGERSR